MFWFLDCFVGAWLTLPRGRPFWSKWATAWKISAATPTASTSTCIAPAALWLWAALAPVALSSVALNLPSQVFEAAGIAVLADRTERLRGARAAAQGATGETRLDYDRTFQLASVEAARLGIAEPIGELYYSFEYNFFGAGGDHDDPWASLAVLPRQRRPPARPGSRRAGQRLGERFYRLRYPIHGGRIAGLPGRIAIAALGLAIAGLSLTGVYIWWRKRRARHWNGAARRLLVWLPPTPPEDGRMNARIAALGLLLPLAAGSFRGRGGGQLGQDAAKAAVSRPSRTGKNPSAGSARGITSGPPVGPGRRWRQVVSDNAGFAEIGQVECSRPSRATSNWPSPSASRTTATPPCA